MNKLLDVTLKSLVIVAAVAAVACQKDIAPPQHVSAAQEDAESDAILKYARKRLLRVLDDRNEVCLAMSRAVLIETITEPDFTTGKINFNENLNPIRFTFASGTRMGTHDIVSSEPLIIEGGKKKYTLEMYPEQLRKIRVEGIGNQPGVSVSISFPDEDGMQPLAESVAKNVIDCKISIEK
jgi:hypothetical protein